MKKLSFLAVAMLIVALPACWRKKADTTPCCTTKCCPLEVRESGPMQDLQEEDMK